jgi:flagellar basal-body rod protein FlgG
MNQSFYIATVGAAQQMKRLNVQGDNIANVNSYGFKTQRVDFAALMYDNILSAENGTLLKGVGARAMSTTTDFSQGGVVDTGRKTDYMIDGRGFFALLDLGTGEVSYTRNGAFSWASCQRATDEVDENGNAVTETVFCLSDEDGRFVLSDQGMLIQKDDYDDDEELPIGIYDYNVYDSMTHLTDTRYSEVEKSGNVRYGTGKLIQGKLEMSNVDLAEEITKVIEAQRAYQAALKMVTTSDEVESTINSLST